MTNTAALSTLCVAQKAGTPTGVLLVADGSCAKIRELLAEALVPVLWLDGTQDPLQIVTAALAERRRQGQPVQTLHWVSHGSPGVLQVGATCVDRNALLVASKQLIEWQVDQLAFWACDYGADKSVVGLWEEVVGASVYSSGSTLGLDTDGQKHWTLDSKWTNKTINWPRHFGDTNRWKYQLGIVSYATFEEGPSEDSEPLTNSEPIKGVGYENPTYGTARAFFGEIENLDNNGYIDYSFLDENLQVDFAFISLPKTLPTEAQLDNLKTFVESGGTLLINGEQHSGPLSINANENANKILKSLGTSISILTNPSSVKDDDFNATKSTDESLIEIGNYEITSGIASVKSSIFGVLEINDQSAEAILVTSNSEANIVMAREPIGSGNVIAFADTGLYDRFKGDNIALFTNIIVQSKQNKDSLNVAPVNTVPGDQSFTEDTRINRFGIITVSDDDGNLSTVQISVKNGIIGIGVTAGAEIINGSNNSANLTLSGSQEQINTALKTLFYTPSADYFGSDTLTVVSTDSGDAPLSDTDTVSITVNPVDDAAVVSEGTTGSGDEDAEAITGTLKATDVDGLTDGTVFSIADGNSPANGTATIDEASGAWSYVPNANFNGTDQFTVTITDDLDGTTAQTVTITVNPVDDAAVVSEGTSDSDDSTAVTGESSVSGSAPSTEADDSTQVSVASNGDTQTPAAQIVTTSEVANDSSLSNLRDLEIALSNKAIDFEVELDDDTSTATANIPLAVLEDDLTLTSDDGERDSSIAPIYYAINDQGALTPLSYDPLVNAGARFYDTDGDGIADFLSLTLVDGGFGDKDGVKNGVIDDPSALGTVSLDPVLTALDNGFLQVADATNAAPAALALQASLTSRANAVTEIGYVILNAGEEASTVSDISAFQERAHLLFSALENNDVTLAEAMTFNSEFLLRNGQSIRFFAVTNGTLADLTSLDDSRFSFLDGSVDATTGAASFSSASGIGFDLTLLNSDQNLGALIAQEQHAAPLLDFTAFTNDETITGTIVQAREAEYDAVTGFYRVLDTSGSVRAADGSLLTPGDAGYAAAALLEANRISALGDLSIADGESSSTEFSLQDASYIAPFAQVEGNTFFAFADANTDGLSHFRSLGSNLFGLEDQLGGGDLDYDDHVFGFNIAGLTPATPDVA
ncbi:Ig-like domain-containing protein [Synechococcus sp. RS9909]|uniref:Ig-like domain-containing protein n=1 Tax=Synechococcus sp. RS9909 TaxID=221352 RepID=UPI00164723F5|nr:Ig-like domain-containing protein [Synechococcus sp. RS9909]